MRTLLGRRVIAVIVFWAVTTSLVGALGASARNPERWYPSRWGADHLAVNWRFTDSFPGGAVRRRVFAGAREWNKAKQTMTFDHVEGEPDYEAYSTSVCPKLEEVEKNGVHWGTVPGGGAYTVMCTFPEGSAGGRAELHSFQIMFGMNTHWYYGKHKPRFYQEDFWSYATHEFGHAGGRIQGGDGHGHFPDSREYCRPTPKAHQSMCQTAPAGTTFDRTINGLDRYVFGGAY
ncbi:MAG TPA: hypothetical protein VNC78_02145 [Actinomycetota bacterium]|nr:hypothetical protein [Actinomycetota bacterium]